MGYAVLGALALTSDLAKVGRSNAWSYLGPYCLDAEAASCEEEHRGQG